MNNKIELKRAYLDNSTIGKMVMPSGKIFDTIELPWKENKNKISCIPEGTYTLKKRVSGIVNRTTKGKHAEGWEVTKVDGRTFIMIHIGNTVDNFEGCIGIGHGLGVINNQWAILNSSKAFDEFMNEMKENEEWELIIKTRTL